MPELARFNGISIKMYLAGKDHNPPHAHAFFGSSSASIDINTGDILEGNLPPAIRKQVKEWFLINKEEVLEIWETQSFHKVPKEVKQ